jgi:hypothetical protein
VPNADVSRCSKLGVQRKELLDHPIGRGGEKGGLDLVAGKASPGLGRALFGAGLLQLEEVLQEGLNVFVGFLRGRLLVVAARKSFFNARIA